MSLSSSTVGGKIKYKIVLLGDQHVGKTSIIDRFINDRFEPNYCATIGIDFLVRNLTYHNKHYRLQIWDTAGQQRFKSLIPSYLKDSNLCILVYDVGDSKTLENLYKWQQLYSQHKQYTALSIVVGNKKDTPTKACSEEMVEGALKNMGGLPHYQISAKTGQGVSQLFYSIIDLINDKLTNIKIIDQIQQKQQKMEKDEKGQTSENVRFPEQSASTLNALKLQKVVVDESGHKKACC